MMDMRHTPRRCTTPLPCQDGATLNPPIGCRFWSLDGIGGAVVKLNLPERVSTSCERRSDHPLSSAGLPS